jgi:hypothetical protein
VIDTRWLHLSGAIGTIPSGGQITSAEWRFETTSSAWFLEVSHSTIPPRRAAIIIGDADGGRCDSAAECGWSWAQHAAWYDAFTSVNAGPLRDVRGFGGYSATWNCGNGTAGTCLAVFKTEAEMEAAVQTLADEPYTSQPYARSTSWDVPMMSLQLLELLRDAITNEGTAFQNEINAALDSENWQRPLPTTTPVGETPSDPGGPRYVEWLAPAVGETYDEYLARLRNRGWVGQAVKVELDGSQGNVEKGLGAVSCTSIASNAIVASDAEVTVYVNPTSSPFGNDEAPTNGHTCGTTEATSCDEPECSFAQEHGSWAQITLGNELWYSLLCDEARSYAQSINLFASDGTPNPSMNIETIADGEKLYDADVRNALAGPDTGRSIGEFRKVKSQYYSPPGGASEFNVHFYIDDTIGKAVLSLGYKIRFRQLYTP